TRPWWLRAVRATRPSRPCAMAVRQLPQKILDQMAEGGRLTVTVAGAPGALGVAQLFVKQGGVTSGRPLFDAGTPLLPGFEPPPRFTF
ncbi:MAG: protein-L-isoaspartate O-methyltransferase, partial [Reyranella sp.]|nr:protein-L-isoaspartate O-methyltransferase [Reyranella sp.]